MTKKKSGCLEKQYRLPAEWEPHEATWLSWPHNIDTWPGKMEPVPAVWAEMVRHLQKSEKVNINVNDEAMERSAKDTLKKAKVPLTNVVFHRFPTNDCWMRDNGPIFVKRENHGKPKLFISKWIFNKWGGKYPPFELDNTIPRLVSEKLNIPLIATGIVMEGGSIDVNGKGTLITTESCLLNKNRNAHLSKKEITDYLKTYFGATNVLWLGEGIVGDDTDGHVDDITRFVNATTVVTAVEYDKSDDNYKPLQDNLKRLKKMKLENGKALKVIELPMPGPLFHEGQRLPASYANFYIANKVVLVPTYRHENDSKAIKILQKVFKRRRVVGIDSTDLVWGLGSFHCVTQQQPK